MSNFKRKQSQVFWKYMESQDLGTTRAPNVFETVDFAGTNEIVENRGASGTSDLPGPKSPSSSPGEDEEGEEKLSDSEYKDIREFETDEPDSWTDGEALPQERSASPRSFVGHRSQDSGFSDSERSEESGVDAYAARVERLRRARTRRSRRRKEETSKDSETEEKMFPEKNSQRLESVWNLTDRPLHPKHTSTPKTSQTTRSRKLSASRPRASRKKSSREFQAHKQGADNPAFNRQDEDEEKNEAEAEIRVPRMIRLSMDDDDECLGDFLYANEPPEDVFEVEMGPSSGVAQSSKTRRTIESRENLNGQLSSVKSWLGVLALETEAECGSTLQSKALPRNRIPFGSNSNGNKSLLRHPQSTDSTLLTASATAAATKLLARVDQFHQRYESAIDELTRPGISRSERSLVQSLEEEAYLLLSELGSPPPQRVRNLSSSREILRQLKELRNEVDHVVDARLDFYVERIVRGLEEAPREEGTAARGALAALTVLGLGPGGLMGGRSIARCSGVRALLTALLSIRGQSSAARDSRAACLRALASVCCCAEAIEQLIINGGPEILADLLSSESAPEIEKMEATALIVQITAPWTNAVGLPHLEPFADDLVPSLTSLVENTSCSQTLLLAAAALNNLALSPRCRGPMVEEKTVAALLRSVKRSGGGSIWLMEQVAALIGELARASNLHPHLAEARASVALVCFLRMRPPGLESAYRRLESTASDALARLCVHREVAQQVVDVGGVNCVIPYQKCDQQIVKNVNTRYTRSLRIACKKAAEQIDAAKLASADRGSNLNR